MSSKPQAGIYGRQSKDSTKSVTEQTAECEADTAAQGWTVAERYADGKSASRFAHGKRGQRDDWARLLADLDAGRLDALVLWESSRGDRTLTTWSAMLDLCRARDVLIRITTHGRTYDPRVGRDWRSLAEDGVDNAYESEKISDRNRRATAAQARAGRPHGRIRYGYERVYDPATRALLGEREHPERAPVVREIVRRVGLSVPLTAIAADLNARGVAAPTGGQWRRGVVRAIALSPAYAGHRVHNGERYPAAWPALVTDTEHLTAVRVLSDPARRTTRPGRYLWLLSYLARCGPCGAHLTRTRPARGGDRYGCSAGACVSVHAEALDELVTDVVVRYLADAELRPPADDGAALAALGEATTLQARLDEWRSSAARGETSPATMAHVEAQLLADIRAAHERAQRASTPAALREVLDGPAGADALGARFRALSVAARREIVGTLLTVDIGPVGRRLAPGERLDVARVRLDWR